MSEGWESGGRHGRGGVDTRALPKAADVDVPYRRIGALFTPYASRLAAAFVLSLAAAALGIAPPLALKEIVDVATKEGDSSRLFAMVAVLVAVPAMTSVLGVVQDRLNTFVGQSVMRDLRRGMFHAVVRQGVPFFSQTKTGDLLQRLTGDVHFVQGVVTSTAVDAATQFVSVVATLIVMFVLDWRLALVATFVIPLCALPLRLVNQRRRAIRLDAQRARSRMATLIAEVFGVSGALLTKVFAREDAVDADFDDVNRDVMSLELRFAFVGRWYQLLTSSMAPLGTAALFWFGGMRVMSGEMSIGSVIAFSAYLAQLLGPTAKLMNVHAEVSAAAVIFTRLFEVLDLPDAAPVRRLATHAEPVAGDIVLDEVSYAYGEGAPDVVDRVSFSIAAGSVTALVGKSGAGKSTLALLIAQLVVPRAGRITIDGKASVEREDVRRQIVFVPQDPFLFHTTLAENLRFAKADATENEMREACRRARIDQVVDALPLGFATVVGERGHRFSGGERQRLAIARALLADPRVLVLDEATAHLDAESEALVREAVAELMRGRTTIVIAHRLSTIVTADDIVVLERGRVVERGRHDDLLRARGLYESLYRAQAFESS
jgi:ATP-binding cassette subfamily B protein